jgi:hypothetical protein
VVPHGFLCHLSPAGSGHFGDFTEGIRSPLRLRRSILLSLDDSRFLDGFRRIGATGPRLPQRLMF